MGLMAEDSPRLRSAALVTIDSVSDSSSIDVCATMMVTVTYQAMYQRASTGHPTPPSRYPHSALSRRELIPSAGASAANVASMFTDCEALLLDAAKKAASCRFLAEGDKTAQSFIPSDCRGDQDGSKTMATTSWGHRTPRGIDPASEVPTIGVDMVLRKPLKTWG